MFDLSDHNQIEVQFSMKEPKVKYKRETQLIEYCRNDIETKTSVCGRS